MATYFFSVDKCPANLSEIGDLQRFTYVKKLHGIAQVKVEFQKQTVQNILLRNPKLFDENGKKTRNNLTPLRMSRQFGKVNLAHPDKNS